MKKTHIILAVLFCLAFTANAQQNILFHTGGNVSFQEDISNVDSVKFLNNNANVFQSGNSQSFGISTIDSVTFSSSTPVGDKIYIIYNGNDVTIINPYANQGITITAQQAYVTSVSTIATANIEYNVLGTSTNGGLLLSSNQDINMVLNNLNLTNPTGAAIQLSGAMTTHIYLTPGTTNTLSDGASSTADATLIAANNILIEGTGSLIVKGLKKHAISNGASFTMEEGNLSVSEAVSDGIHTVRFEQNGGTISTSTTGGDGIDASEYVKLNAGTITVNTSAVDVKGIKSAGYVTVNGGQANISVSGNASKGISSTGNISLISGSVSVTASGSVALTASGSGFDPSYATGIKTDARILVSGGTLNVSCTSTNAGGKALSAKGQIISSGGTSTIITAGNGSTYVNSTGATDSYASAGIVSDSSISILAGTLNITNSGSGGKGISSKANVTIGSLSTSPTISVNNTGSQFLVTGTNGAATASYSTPKCIKSDGIFSMTNGNLTISVSNQNSNGIDSEGAINILGGTISCTLGGNQSKGIKSATDIHLTAGSVNVTATGGVFLETSGSGKDPSYCTAIKSSTTVNLNGSTITISGSGAAFKGISSGSSINMTAGTVGITSSGSGATYVNASGATDSYSSAAFSADANISITGGQLTTSSSGSGGKGLKADGTISIGSNGTNPITQITTTGARFQVQGTDYCHPKTIVSTGAVNIYSGTTTIASTDDGIHSDASITISGGTNTVSAISTTQGVGEGVEAPIINFTGGVTNITASNDGINATYGTVAGGTESNDNSKLNISGGIIIVAGSDAIDSNGNITITGGTTIVCGPTNQPEEGIDFNGTFLMNGGMIISAGSNANMTKNFSNGSTQRCMYMKSSAQLAASSMLHIRSSTGTEMVTFKPKNGVYYFHFSSPNVAASTSYQVYFGGSYTGGSFVGNSNGWGLYTGGTYSTTGGTLKSTFTTSGTNTLNTITF